MLEVCMEVEAAKIEEPLFRKWITLPMDEDELKNEIRDILKEAHTLGVYNVFCPEADIRGFKWDEDIYELFPIDTNDTVYEINRKLLLIEDEVMPYGYKKIKFLFDNGYAYSVENAIEKIIDVDIYENCSLEAVARYRFDDKYGEELDDRIRQHIDFKYWGQTLRHEGYFQEETDVFYYGNH